MSSENGVPLGDGHQREKGPGAGAGAAEAGRKVVGASRTGAKSSRPATAIDSPDGGAGGAGGQAPA